MVLNKKMQLTTATVIQVTDLAENNNFKKLIYQTVQNRIQFQKEWFKIRKLLRRKWNAIIEKDKSSLSQVTVGETVDTATLMYLLKWMARKQSKKFQM